MSKVIVNGNRVIFWCVPCGHPHAVPFKNEAYIWDFNGNLDRPSINPSVKNTWTMGEEHTPHLCHLVLTDGFVHYCGDCLHGMAGQTMELSEFPESYGNP